jgi:hypothetical protein
MFKTMSQEPLEDRLPKFREQQDAMVSFMDSPRSKSPKPRDNDKTDKTLKSRFIPNHETTVWFLVQR